jgi:hypothetical protein
MKVECSQCGEIGILETRGSSQRVLHYRGFVNGKRVYEKHAFTPNNGNNGSKSLGIKSRDLSPNGRKLAGEEGFEPSTPNLGGWCSLRAANERTLDPYKFGSQFNVSGYPY